MSLRFLACKCPRCEKGSLFRPGLTLDLNGKCGSCGLPLSDNDCGDGPAVFLIFILGFLLVPLALLTEWLIGLPLWLHAILWGAVALGITLGALRPVKSLVIHLQFKHRPGAWEDQE